MVRRLDPTHRELLSGLQSLEIGYNSVVGGFTWAAMAGGQWGKAAEISPG